MCISKMYDSNGIKTMSGEMEQYYKVLIHHMKWDNIS